MMLVKNFVVVVQTTVKPLGTDASLILSISYKIICSDKTFIHFL